KSVTVTPVAWRRTKPSRRVPRGRAGPFGGVGRSLATIGPDWSPSAPRNQIHDRSAGPPKPPSGVRALPAAQDRGREGQAELCAGQGHCLAWLRGALLPPARYPERNGPDLLR